MNGKTEKNLLSKKVKFSIVIPVYQAERYIERCIDSILSQSYTEWEVILIDDGSTDRSRIVCDCYAESDLRIKIWHQVNQGVAAARNIGITKAVGDYLMFVDADDYLVSDALEILNNTIETSDADMIIYGAYREKDGRIIAENKYDSTLITRGNIVSNVKFILEGINHNSVWNKIFRRDIIDDFGIMFPPIKIGEDGVFVLRFWQSCWQRVEIIDRVLYHYEQNSNSVTHRFSPDLWSDQMCLLNEMRQFLKTIYSDENMIDDMLVHQYRMALIYEVCNVKAKDCRMSKNEKIKLLRQCTSEKNVNKALKGSIWMSDIDLFGRIYLFCLKYGWLKLLLI